MSTADSAAAPATATSTARKAAPTAGRGVVTVPIGAILAPRLDSRQPQCPRCGYRCPPGCADDDRGVRSACRWMKGTPGMKRYLAALVLIAAGIGGCGSGHADKAGGVAAPVVLRLGVVDAPNQPGYTDIRFFAARVGELSHGRMRVDAVFSAAGDRIPAIEPALVGLVRAGRYQLGWIGARGWDQLGVTSLRALQSPFLIDSRALLDSVVTSPIARQMLAGIRHVGMEGLALVPDQLRYVFGRNRAFASLQDFSGAAVRVNPSRATDALIRALGATPVHVDNHSGGTPAQQKLIAAREAGISNASGLRLTVNEPLF